MLMTLHHVDYQILNARVSESCLNIYVILIIYQINHISVYNHDSSINFSVPTLT